MDSAKRIVTRTPLTELWNSRGMVEAHRVGDIGKADIVQLLRNGSTFVVAEVGQPLLWIPEEERFAFWKAEVSSRLVAPGAVEFHLDDYPDEYCYVAAMWQRPSSTSVIVVEKHH
ncbi:MAG: hypothetical protein ACKVP3_01090 [Hyphomicrobiaceae bacterium]